MNPVLLAYLQLFAGALLLSTGSAAVKASQLPAFELAGWRGLVITLFVMLAVSPPRLTFSRRVLPAAAAHAATTLLFMSANKLTTAATAIFLQYTSPLYLLLLGPWLLKEPVARRDYFYLCALLLGMVVLLLNPPGRVQTAPHPVLGGMLAAVCGVTWALTTLTMRGLAREATLGFERTMASVVVANAALAVCILPWSLAHSGLPPLRDLGLAGYMGVFQLGSSFILISLGLRRVTALEGALILLVEPVVNPLWVWLLHGEQPGPWSLLGGALVLTASAARAVHIARLALQDGSGNS